MPPYCRLNQIIRTVWGRKRNKKWKFWLFFFEKINKNFHAHSLSTELVASSKIRILFFLNNALPKHSNCLYGFYGCFKSTRWHGIKNYLKYFLIQFRWIKFKKHEFVVQKEWKLRGVKWKFHIFRTRNNLKFYIYMKNRAKKFNWKQ